MEAETSAGEWQNNIDICLNIGEKVIFTPLKDSEIIIVRFLSSGHF